MFKSSDKLKLLPEQVLSANNPNIFSGATEVIGCGM